MSRINNDFAVIDIGTNAVKGIAFVNGQQVDTFRNRMLTQSGNSNLNPQEILDHVEKLIKEAEGKGVSPDKIYIAATEGFRKSSNQREISNLIKERTGRAIHKISPKREAYLSALGGLSYIQNGFKGNPSKVIYIEAGGGSTEISLIDARKRSFLAIEATVSVPLGSKNKIDAGVVSETMNGFMKSIGAKIKKDDDIAIVINSSAASRIMSRRYDKEKYNPKAVAEKQYAMRLHNFLKQLSEMTGMEQEEIKAQFYLDDEKLDGFLNHSAILQAILKKLYQTAKQARVSTTIGGLKHGLVREISSVKSKDLDKIFGPDETIGSETSLIIGTENEETAQKTEKANDKKRETRDMPKAEEKEKEKNVWAVKVKKAVFEANKMANGKFDFREIKEAENSQNKVVAFEDVQNKNNKIKFTSAGNATVIGDINAYYAICETAKRLGRNIRFGQFNSIEKKALLYQACLEKGMAMENEPAVEELKDCPNFAKIKKLKEAARKSRTNNPPALFLPRTSYESRMRA